MLHKSPHNTCSEKDTWVILVSIAPTYSNVLQSLLLAEDGLATVRCMDGDVRIQQLWTSTSQRDELHAWLATLPEKIELQVLEEYLWTPTPQ